MSLIQKVGEEVFLHRAREITASQPLFSWLGASIVSDFDIRISDFLGVDIRSKLFQFSFEVSFTVSDLRLAAQAFLTPSGKPNSMMHPR